MVYGRKKQLINIILGFSLVELMVVIAIIGILSAIAVPSYKSYIIKTNISSAIPIVTHVVDQAIQYYDTNNSFANPLSIYNTSLSNGAFVNVVASPVLYLQYVYNTTYNSVYVCTLLSNIGTPGYVAPTGNNGKYNKFCMAAVLNNTGIYNKYCGVWGNGEIMSIPSQYLPSGCTCSSISNMVTGGTGC